MTTTKSYSEKFRFLSIYKLVLKNQLPFAVVNAIIFTILMPLIYFVSFVDNNAGGNTVPELITQYYQQQFYCGVYVSNGQAGFVMVALIVLALVAALINNNHMHSKKMTDLYHSLPVRRPHLLTANMLAALTAILVPFLAVYLVTFLCQMVPYGRHLMGFAPYFQYIGVDLCIALVVTAVSYVFTTFIATMVGTTFDAFALTGIIGLLPLTVWSICLGVWGNMTYGAQTDLSNVLLLCPFLFGLQRFKFMQYNSTSVTGILPTLISAAIWLVIGILLYFAAIACYKRRKSEIAEQAQSQGTLQTIAKCFGAFCGGALFFAIFYKTGNLFVWAVAILIGAVLIGFIAEVILSRGLRSFGKNLKWLIASGILCLLLVVVSDLDPTGYTARVPVVDDVVSVSVSYGGRFDQLSDQYPIYYNGYYARPDAVLTQPESIAVVAKAHEMIVSDRPPRSYAISDEADNLYPYNNVNLTYTLKNGGTLTRTFSRTNLVSYLYLSNLEDKDDFIQAKHAIFNPISPSTKGGETLEFFVSGMMLYQANGLNGRALNLDPADTRRLLEAARQDMLEEPLEEILNPKSPARGYLTVQYSASSASQDYLAMQEQYNYYGNNHATGTVVIGAGYTRTLAVLAGLNLLDAMDSAASVDRVTFRSAYHDFGNINRVTVLMPDMEYNLDKYRDELWQLTTTDSSEISRSLAAGRNQMLVSSRDYQNCDAVIMTYFHEDTKAGAQLVRITDLPANIQEQLKTQYAQDEYLMKNGVIPPEKVAYAVETPQQQIPATDMEISVGNPEESQQ